MEALGYEHVYPNLRNDLITNKGILERALHQYIRRPINLPSLAELKVFELPAINAHTDELLPKYSSNFVTLCETLRSDLDGGSDLDGMSQENKIEIAELLISLSTIIELIIIGKATVEHREGRSSFSSHDTNLNRNNLDTAIVIHGFEHFVHAHNCRKVLLSMILGDRIFEDSFHDLNTHIRANLDCKLADQYVIFLVDVVCSARSNWYDDGDGNRSFLRSYRRAVTENRDILANETSHARNLGCLHYILDRYIARIREALAA